jgi:RNA polymerase sigma factor (sigma-70 family)
MTEIEGLAARFEADRPHLRAVAQRILGSPDEAEDAVQEAWVRLSRSDTGDVGNLTGWLTTVVSRICLDMLRSRTARREEPAELPEVPAGDVPDPEHQALMADAIGPALLLVLDTLGPAERLAFVLHDMFAVPFPEIAEIVGCSPAAARQLASRARRRVQHTATAEPAPSPTGSEATAPAGPTSTGPAPAGRTATGPAPAGHPSTGPAPARRVVDAFLAAAHGGDFTALLALLDPDVELRADAAGVKMGAAGLVRGPRAVAETFAGRARGARVALIDGSPGLVWMAGAGPRVVFAFTVTGGRVTGIDLLADPDTLTAMTIDT